jgi:NAD-dependent deacetylase
MPSADPSTSAEALARILGGLRGGRLVVCTGAGVSLASGLATFRGADPDAVWSQVDVEMGTREFFEADPVESWRWYADRFTPAFAAEPNATHEALAALEHWFVDQGGEFLLVTQNVDLLHERAGSRNLIKVHGSLDRVRCSRIGCDHGAPRGSLPVDEGDFRRFDVAGPGKLPRCSDCGSLLRPHVLWFDEMYADHEDYRYEEVRAGGWRMDAILFVGTSFSVGVTALLLQATVMRDVPAISIDPGADPARTPPEVALIAEPAEVLLPAVCERLGVAVESSA